MKELSRQAERRYRNAFQRLGTDRPTCCACGEMNPLCLERHHIAGRIFSDEQVIICRNCHRKQTDLQQDHPAPLSEQSSLLERIGHYLLGLSDLFRQFAERLNEYGAYLITIAETVLSDLREGGA